ncbi:glycosyltransferase family 2 protein [Salegentibacter sp. Hel_I_6]|uniref:glycosyltransferase family 2 protein n=1 Tax=Salegentibacter sp. Hel_I_6 TaxID=1250278 RepID=UPI000566DBED|nr:glycosyltransferase [Salegentibacter sp. Hel_I_6]
MGSKFSILITTFNRLEELKYTLTSLEILIRDGVRIIICDDASTDGTSAFIREKYPKIQLLINPVNKGLIYSRNLLMDQVKTPYAISLDDDANFISPNPFQKILEYFKDEPKCGVIAFRIFWGLSKPKITCTYESSQIVKSFVGCAHVWRMKAWREIPSYPDWYRFYGEENFASLQLFKKGWGVHYMPSVLVHHRVDNKARRKERDYYWRIRRSLRADWYNFMIFYPKSKIIRIFIYSIKNQILKAKRTKDIKFLKSLFLGIGDLLMNTSRLKKNQNSLTYIEYQKWKELPDAKIYWRPDLSVTHKE